MYIWLKHCERLTIITVAFVNCIWKNIRVHNIDIWYVHWSQHHIVVSHCLCPYPTICVHFLRCYEIPVVGSIPAHRTKRMQHQDDSKVHKEFFYFTLLYTCYWRSRGTFLNWLVIIGGCVVLVLCRFCLCCALESKKADKDVWLIMIDAELPSPIFLIIGWNWWAVVSILLLPWSWSLLHGINIRDGE